MNFAGLKIDVPDVDEASSQLQTLSSKGHQNNAAIEPIASARVLDLSEDEMPTIADLYDTILQNWVAPLPSDVPIRVRQHKERLARRMAAEVILATSRIRPGGMRELNTESIAEPSQDNGILLPILPSKPGDNIHSDGTQWPSLQALPTPPHSSLPSSSMIPSSPPLSPANPPAPADPIARLGKHLQIRDTSATPTIIPTNVNQLLAHWQPGTDPHTYDWDATERLLQPEDIDESSNEQREKARRRRERRQKRQQREDELARAKSTSQPVVFPRSSLGPMLGGMASSSQMGTQVHSQIPVPNNDPRGLGGIGGLGAPQSQVEPGRFGGRLDKKKKKKGRVSGF